MNIVIKLCEICNKKLTGRQTKFCSKACKSKTKENSNNNYKYQQKRGWERKIDLVNMLGGSCQNCGYNKCLRALTFHHIDRKNKKFNLDIRKISGTPWLVLLEEAKKCKLLCANCHFEVHFLEDSTKQGNRFGRDQDKKFINDSKRITKSFVQS